MGKHFFETCKQCLVLMTVKTSHALCINAAHLNSRQLLWTRSRSSYDLWAGTSV